MIQMSTTNKSKADRRAIFGDMNSGRPYASYKKVILGKILVRVWDNFTETPSEIIVEGDPRQDEEAVIIDVWSEAEKVYFERMNRKHFQADVLVPYTRKQKVEPEEKPLALYTDEELSGVINSKFFSFQATLNKVESEATLFRIKTLAEDLEKSEKVMKLIEARISEVQNGDLSANKKE